MLWQRAWLPVAVKAARQLLHLLLRRRGNPRCKRSCPLGVPQPWPGSILAAWQPTQAHGMHQGLLLLLRLLQLHLLASLWRLLRRHQRRCYSRRGAQEGLRRST